MRTAGAIISPRDILEKSEKAIVKKPIFKKLNKNLDKTADKIAALYRQIAKSAAAIGVRKLRIRNEKKRRISFDRG